MEELVERTSKVMEARKRRASAAPEATKKAKSGMHVAEFLRTHSGDRAARQGPGGGVLSEEELLAQLASKVTTLDAKARESFKCAVLCAFANADGAGPPQHTRRSSSSPAAPVLPVSDPAEPTPKAKSGVHVADLLTGAPRSGMHVSEFLKAADLGSGGGGTAVATAGSALSTIRTSDGERAEIAKAINSHASVSGSACIFAEVPANDYRLDFGGDY